MIEDNKKYEMLSTLDLIINITLSCIHFRGDDGRISQGNRIIWNIRVDVGIRSNQNIITNCYFPDDHGIWTDPDFVTDDGNAFVLSAVGLRDSHTLSNIAILPDLSFRIDDKLTPMS